MLSGPHTASHRECPKSPYTNHREAPAPIPRPTAPKPAPRPAPKSPETRKPQLQPPARPANPAIPEDKLDEAARSANYISPQLLVRPRKPQSLQFVFWNANGLRTKKAELASNRLSLRNLWVHRTDRKGVCGGGTAILIKPTIDHHADLALDLNNIEATAITRRKLLEDDLSEIFDTRGAVILAGDLNAKHPRETSWNSRLTNASTCLRHFADDLRLLVDATADPTIFPHNGQPDVLDSGDEGCRTIPPTDRSQRALVRLQPSAAATWINGTRRRGILDTPDGVVARFRGSPLRQHRSYHGDRRPNRARNNSTPSHRARIQQLKIRNQHLACRRRQSLHPQGSPRPDTGDEQAPKTVAENVKPGYQSRIQSNGETD
ncbi:hypothetical protein Trydic_g7524 [Trypoxylus dichotomus]